MANLTPATTFDDVYQLETTDAVLAGAGGIANAQAQALTNRTAYLRFFSGMWNRVGDIITMGDGDVIGPLDAGVLINANTAGGNIIIKFNDISVFTTGMVFFIKCVGAKSATISTFSSGYAIKWGSLSVQKIYLHDGEFLKIVVNGSNLEVLDCSQSIAETGDAVLGIMERRGTLLKDGRILNRADYPRLWAFINDTSHSYFQLVSLSLWSSVQSITDDGGHAVSVYPYRGFFHTGDGSTTFGLPDERGMSDRYLDLGRGIDDGRMLEKVGGYAHDGLMSHSHEQQTMTAIGNGGPKPAGYLNTANDLGGHGYHTLYAGGAETRVKNVAKLPLIKI